jgi:hypothetical protein
MTAETVFTLCNLAVIPPWILLAVAPGWVWTQRLVHAIWMPLLLGPVYLWALLAATGVPADASFGSLHGVMQFFTAPHAALAGWIHYLVFDLFIGAWEVRDARRRRIPHLALLPCLFFTFLFGPSGLMAYLLLRAASRQVWSLAE